MNNALYVACQGAGKTTGQWGPVGRLERIGEGYRFLYTQGAKTLPGFRPFYGMPGFEAVYESEELFPQFANRLLSHSRPEYEESLIWGGFDPADPPDPISLLGVTGGRRATDSLELFPSPIPDEQGRYIIKFFLHGVQWMPDSARNRLEKLSTGDLLGMMLDISNPYDHNAVAVRTFDIHDRFLIGYVPRYLARDIGGICQTGETDAFTLTVERVNPSAPFQQRLLCRMTTNSPNAVALCSGLEYQPIVEAQVYSHAVC